MSVAPRSPKFFSTELLLNGIAAKGSSNFCPPGEVTNAALASALASALATAVSGTSNNSNAVLTLDTPFADPDAESMRLRFNELVLALRR